jgi:hypothetical protein
MNVLITVDTEEDNQWQSNVSTTSNLEYLPRFQEFCEKFNLKPTYLCTYGVVESEFFRSILAKWQSLGKAEIGAHLHSWSTPPFDPAFDNSTKGKPYPSEIPILLFEKKLKSLTDLIHDKTGIKPRSYRAGRWGFISEHIAVLEKLGYSVDSSVTPFMSWKSHKGLNSYGPDFITAPFKPYRPDYQNVCRAGNSKILEIPVTILAASRFLRDNEKLRLWYLNKRGLIRKLGELFKLKPRWLRPVPWTSAGGLIQILKIAEKAGLPCVNFMLHSSELLAGGSPYNPDERSIENLYLKFDRLFTYMILKKKWKGLSMSEIPIADGPGSL